jgi:hypothetical protein
VAVRHPYQNLPNHRYWRTGVSAYKAGLVEGLYQPKFQISADDKIATAGSCFAQHIARTMRAAQFKVLDVEPGPLGLAPGEYGFGLYSARYGNIYQARALLELAKEAFGQTSPTGWVWQRGGKYFDAFRQSVEPGGYSSEAEVTGHRKQHLRRVRALFEDMDVFVFTLGLTEAWLHKREGYVVSSAPGVVADPACTDDYLFHNFTQIEVLSDLQCFLELVRQYNSSFRMILTVSPVPLVATAETDHVLTATVYSKSVLRAVAGELAAGDDCVAYFPSYELITGALARGQYFEENMRSVKPEGVAYVMQHFLEAHPPVGDGGMAVFDENEDDICDEILNDAFAAKEARRD